MNRLFTLALLTCLLALTTPAFAHAPIMGVGGVLGGFLHALLIPEHGMSLVALGLALGRQEALARRYGLLMFTAAVTAGSLRSTPNTAELDPHVRSARQSAGQESVQRDRLSAKAGRFAPSRSWISDARVMHHVNAAWQRTNSGELELDSFSSVIGLSNRRRGGGKLIFLLDIVYDP
jgi:hypothetical protein